MRVPDRGLTRWADPHLTHLEGTMNYTVRNLLIASALMLLGILAITSFMRSERRDFARGKQEISVQVATKEIPAGTTAKEIEEGGYLETTEVLREDAPANPVTKLADLKKNDVLNDTVYEGEVLNATAFDSTAGLKPTSQIRGNERLFAIPVPSAMDAAGLIRQGDHVDILASMQVAGTGEGGGDTTVTAVVARDIEIVETPATLVPEGVEATAAAPEADGELKLYVLKSTDAEMTNIKFAMANADDDGLMLSLRPASGSTESKVTPVYGAVTKPVGGVPTKVGPDPSVK